MTFEGLSEDETATVLVLVGEHLDAPALCSLARCSRLFRDVVRGPNAQALVWKPLFERSILLRDGSSFAERFPRSWDPLSWSERVRALAPLRRAFFHPQCRSVWSYGCWLVAVSDPSQEFVWIVSRDRLTATEFYWEGNGWFRQRTPTTPSCTVWTKGDKSYETLAESAFEEILAEKAEAVQPLVPGMIAKWGGDADSYELDSDPEWNKPFLNIEVREEGLVVHVDAAPPADTVFFPREDPSSVVFKGMRLQDIPFEGQHDEQDE